MSSILDKFLADAEKSSFDPEHRRRLDFNIGRYDEKVITGKQQYFDIELARRRAAMPSDAAWRDASSSSKSDFCAWMPSIAVFSADS